MVRDEIQQDAASDWLRGAAAQIENPSTVVELWTGEL